MRWLSIGLLVLVLLAFSACKWRGAAEVTPTQLAPSPPSPSTVDIELLSAPEAATITATNTPNVPVPPISEGTSSFAVGPHLDSSRVNIYPMSPVTGDIVSFDVEPVLFMGYESPYTVTLGLPGGTLLSSPVIPSGFDRNPRARFVWAWDTTGLAGTLEFTVTLLIPHDVPDAVVSDNVLTLTLTLADPVTLLPPEPNTRWEKAVSGDIRLHYLVGSAAERDLGFLMTLATDAYADVAARFGIAEATPLDVYLLDRVVGQGGYATSDWVAVSYTDRAYAPSEMALLLRHELTHRLDGAWGCDKMPSLFREGLAVMVAGGHYWPESLPLKAATLLSTGNLIPLNTLVEDFYRQQHEIGYLEAGALLSYLVEERGWEGIAAMCAAAGEATGDDRLRFDEALAAIGMSELPQLEKEWLRWLRSMRTLAGDHLLLEYEWALMDTLRLYQLRYDRAANYLTGVLFDPEAAVRRGITADFARKPHDAEAIATELLLQTAREALRSGDSEKVELLLSALTRSIEGVQDKVVEEMEALATAVRDRGYEPYRTVCVDDGGEVGQRAPGCIVYALDRGEWPVGRLLWAARVERDGSWVVVGPQMVD